MSRPSPSIAPGRARAAAPPPDAAPPHTAPQHGAPPHTAPQHAAPPQAAPQHAAPGRSDQRDRGLVGGGWPPLEPATNYRPRPEHLFRPALVRAARERMKRRRRRTAVLALIVAAAGLVGADLVRGDPQPVARVERPAATTAPPARPGAAADARVTAPGHATRTTGSFGAGRRPDEVTYPDTGAGTFTVARGAGPVLGSGGVLRRFQVAVEEGAGLDADAFARDVEEILGDRRGWAASGLVRWQRVPPGASAQFTVLLATPGTSERVCATGGLQTEKFTNCRLPGKVVINLSRWQRAVPGYGAPLAEYRAYALNHEVGHQLGYGHEACPGRGQFAPVMQQQTLGLNGCRANGWPYVAGRRHTGPPTA